MSLIGRVLAIRPYCYRNHLFVERPGTPKPVLRTDEDYRIEFPVDPRDLAGAQLERVGLTAATLQARIQAGDLVGLVYFGDRVVHRSLLQTVGVAAMEGDRQAFELAGGDSYIHSSLTVADHRGRGLYAAMLRTIADVGAREAPDGRVFIACRRENVASVRAILRGGFRYLRSSVVVGVAAGRLRLRRWYTDPEMAMEMADDPSDMPRDA